MPYTHHLAHDPYPVGAQLTSSDPEPTGGTIVEAACCADRWYRSHDYEGPANWFLMRDDDVDAFCDPDTWTKVAGNYGPVTVVEAPDAYEMELARRWLR